MQDYWDFSKAYRQAHRARSRASEVGDVIAAIGVLLATGGGLWGLVALAFSWANGPSPTSPPSWLYPLGCLVVGVALVAWALPRALPFQEELDKAYMAYLAQQPVEDVVDTVLFPKTPTKTRLMGMNYLYAKDPKWMGKCTDRVGRLLNSPELDEGQREEMVFYFNTYAPGWSVA